MWIAFQHRPYFRVVLRPLDRDRKRKLAVSKARTGTSGFKEKPDVMHTCNSGGLVRKYKPENHFEHLLVEQTSET
jgi:hypothetical protein